MNKKKDHPFRNGPFSAHNNACDGINEAIEWPRSSCPQPAQAVGNLCSLKRSRSCSLEILPVAV